jgi:hypothetical protein
LSDLSKLVFSWAIGATALTAVLAFHLFDTSVAEPTFAIVYLYMLMTPFLLLPRSARIALPRLPSRVTIAMLPILVLTVVSMAARLAASDTSALLLGGCLLVELFVFRVDRAAAASAARRSPFLAFAVSTTVGASIGVYPYHVKATLLLSSVAWAAGTYVTVVGFVSRYLGNSVHAGQGPHDP